jgi:hypothetical protein
MHARRKKRPPCYDPAPAAPLVQVMSDQMARIDPTVVPQLTCYLLALRERHERQARETLTHRTGRSRAIQQGRIAWAQCMCEALDAIMASLYQTIDLRAYDRAQAEYQRMLRDIGGEG